MTISGKSIYKRIEKEVRDTEDSLRGLVRGLSTIEDNIRELTADREDIYSRLAGKYLPSLDAESIRGTLRQVQGQVNRIYRQKQRERDSIEDSIEANGRARAGHQQRLKEIVADLDDAADQRDKLRQEMEVRLAEDASYVSLRQEFETLSAEVAKYEQAYSDFVDRSDDKLRSFRANPLFMYLMERDFDPAHSRGLIGRLDRAVANLIGYPQALRNYRYLTMIPSEMQQIYTQRQEQLRRVAEQVDTYEDDMEQEVGLDQVLARGKKLASKRDEVLELIHQVDIEDTRLKARRRKFDGSMDPYYQEAKEKLSAYLKGETLNSLFDLVHSTPDPEDDGLVERLQDVDHTLHEQKQAAKARQKEVTSYERRLEDLKDLLRDFERKDYESSRSYFPDDFDIGDLLEELASGDLSRSKLWKIISRHQEFESRTYTPTYTTHRYSRPSSSYSSSSDDDGYGSGSSGRSNPSPISSGWTSSPRSSGGFGTSSGFGGGGFSTGGRIGGGGFKTKGGF